jgi:hypothetical protein
MKRQSARTKRRRRGAELRRVSVASAWRATIFSNSVRGRVVGTPRTAMSRIDAGRSAAGRRF